MKARKTLIIAALLTALPFIGGHAEEAQPPWSKLLSMTDSSGVTHSPAQARIRIVEPLNIDALLRKGAGQLIVEFEPGSPAAALLRPGRAEEARIHYFDGRFLTARDLTVEQTYFESGSSAHMLKRYAKISIMAVAVGQR